MQKRVVLFGMGNKFREFCAAYDDEKIQIVAVSDNSKDIKVLNSCGFTMVLPDEIASIDCDCILVTSSYYSEIKRQLLGMGIDLQKIIDGSSMEKIYKNTDFLKTHNIIVDMFEEQRREMEDLREALKNMYEKNLYLSAKNFIDCHYTKRINSLEEVEFQVHSQFGEDGIIQWLIHNTEIKNKVFIEFGVENYKEANTRFLLKNNNWSGLVIDGSQKNIQEVLAEPDYWKYDLKAVSEFITRDNINDIIINSGIEGEIGLLSVDVDGNDYWILNNITCVNPAIIVCEYNSIFGDEFAISVPYDKEFYRTRMHYSNLYWGGSLKAFCYWADIHNYYFIGSNSAGNNAFFVRKDCFSEEMLPGKCEYVESKYRESRGKSGELTYLSGDKRIEVIKDMPVTEVITGKTMAIVELFKI